MPTRVNSYSSTTSASSGSSSASSASSSGTSTPTASAAQPTFGDNKGIRFEIRTGTNRWTCTLQDRSIYERTKATRTNSTDSVASDASGSTIASP